MNINNCTTAFLDSKKKHIYSDPRSVRYIDKHRRYVHDPFKHTQENNNFLDMKKEDQLSREQETSATNDQPAHQNVFQYIGFETQASISV
jgi:hypothetical protein